MRNLIVRRSKEKARTQNTSMESREDQNGKGTSVSSASSLALPFARCIASLGADVLYLLIDSETSKEREKRVEQWDGALTSAIVSSSLISSPSFSSAVSDTV